MENSTVRRGIVLLVLVTCSILVLWWVTDRAKENSPTPTPSATLSITTSG